MRYRAFHHPYGGCGIAPDVPLREHRPSRRDTSPRCRRRGARNRSIKDLTSEATRCRPAPIAGVRTVRIDFVAPRSDRVIPCRIDSMTRAEPGSPAARPSVRPATVRHSDHPDRWRSGAGAGSRDTQIERFGRSMKQSGIIRRVASSTRFPISPPIGIPSGRWADGASASPVRRLRLPANRIPWFPASGSHAIWRRRRPIVRILGQSLRIIP